MSRGLSWLTAGAMSTLIAACGGGGQSPILGTVSVSPVVPPTVTLVTPLPNASGVALNARTITAAFSKPMDAGTLSAASFTLACPAATVLGAASITYAAASKIATLTLPVGTLLPASTVCKATVTTAARDTTGLAIAADYVWRFTTGVSADITAPTVTNTINANGATSVATNAKVGATFSEAMNPLTLTNSSFTLKQTLCLGPPVTQIPTPSSRLPALCWPTPTTPPRSRVG
ncbi:Ig-like domain-containing protein [bacterium]|nr:Ig-like domain-containing protein [bacterium]